MPRGDIPITGSVLTNPKRAMDGSLRCLLRAVLARFARAVLDRPSLRSLARSLGAPEGLVIITGTHHHHNQYPGLLALSQQCHDDIMMVMMMDRCS